MTAQPDTQTNGHYVQVNGLNIYYEEQGEGQPLLLIHGGILTGASWQPYLPAFASHFRVIMPDSRGHGRTNNPTGEMSFRLLADDMAGLVQALGLQKPLICGYSDGGQVALEIGMRYPDLPQALVIGGAYPELTEASQVWVQSILGDEHSPDVDIEKFERENADFATMIQGQQGDDWKTLLRQIKPMWNARLNYTKADFASVIAHTLIIQGDRDNFVPVEEALEMFRLLPNAEFAVVPAADHGELVFSAEKIALVQPVMLDFLLRQVKPLSTQI